MRRHLPAFTALVLACSVAACADSDDYAEDDVEKLDPTPPPGKEDSQNRRGLFVNTNTTRTQVWTARNKWEDTDTAAARAAGLAWSANSGLNWDEKFSAWVDSLRWIPGADGYSQTIELTTPWGKTLPSPVLECAEQALFLRITFSAWYELPLFFESASGSTRIYFGHNGIRTASGVWNNMPEFGVRYTDHSAMAESAWRANWPKDTALRGRRLSATDDRQVIAANATIGTYLDEIHLNKRAGHFTAIALAYLGSANLADTANTYNIVPEAVRSGDVLIQRWQRSGIGHTLVVKETHALGEASKDFVTISGSMPRRQAKRESGVASKGYFTSAYAGGPGTNSDGHAYATLGGGAKRFRVTKNVDGYWTNTWMQADEASWIDSTDTARIAARPARFQSLLGQASPAQQRTELLAQIEDARRHLGNYPASCAARARRERAFDELYEVSRTGFGQTRAQVDAAHRKLEDYVFGELDYARSKTCCWNQSTRAMSDIIMDLARKDVAAAAANGTCAAPAVFKSETTGYQRWASHAATLGRAAEWRPWSEDETCAGRNVPSDAELASAATAWCSLASNNGGGTSCTDAFEPNESRAAARTLTGTHDLQLCANDQDWFKITAGGTVTITFSHAAGDLDLAAYDAAGNQVATSQSVGNSETVTVPAGGTVRVYGYQGATGAYRITAP